REAKEVINAVVLKVRKQRNLHDCFFSLFPGGRGTMWSATLAFPSLVASSTSLSCCRNRRLPKIQASLSSYPLASKIMVRNLPFSTSEDFLQKEFSAFGEVSEVKLVKDESMKRSKSYAFIQFTSQDDAFLKPAHIIHILPQDRCFRK
ncbi:hypothetical protein HID58_012390, partial [Brassica napus]